MLNIVILGIIQGIAEFLPISSSAHLIIAREIFNIGVNIPSNIELTFDVALHFGTSAAVIVFFFKELWPILTDGLTKGTKTKDGKIFWRLFVAMIPAAIVGILLEDIIENFFRKQIWIISLALIVMGIIIFLVDKKSNEEKSMKDMSFKEAFLIGCAQVFSLIPGFSRSGTTIAAGRILKFNKEDSAKFSFYLSVPIVLGATLLTLFKENTIAIISENLVIFGLGILISFLVGMFCISFLLKYIKKHDFKLFMIYRIILGIVILLMLL